MESSAHFLLFFVSFVRTLSAEGDVWESVLGVTKLGRIEGEVFVVNGGFKVNAFRGIPYAQPPVNNLQFQVSLFHSLRFSGFNIV